MDASTRLPIRVVQSVASLDNPDAGPTYSVPALCRGLAHEGAQVELHCTGKRPGSERADGFPIYRHAREWSSVPYLRKLNFSSEFSRALSAKLGPCVFHTHGLWTHTNVSTGLIAAQINAPLVISPRGMLGREALRYSAIPKATMWWLGQKRACMKASCFHATSYSEYEEIRRKGFHQPVAVIPNGIELPDLSKIPIADARADRPYILSLGRIHPKKGLDTLIEAFASLAPKHPNWQLRIVGPDEGGHANSLAKQAEALGINDSVSIEGPVRGVEKFALMRNAAFFALPTKNENFAMTVAESLSVGTPVISTRGAPWKGLNDRKCGWWIDRGAAAMAAAMSEAIALPDQERKAMGDRGREWMQQDFDWKSISIKMIEVYEWLTSNTKRPQFVLGE